MAKNNHKTQANINKDPPKNYEEKEFSPVYGVQPHLHL